MSKTALFCLLQKLQSFFCPIFLGSGIERGIRSSSNLNFDFKKFELEDIKMKKKGYKTNYALNRNKKAIVYADANGNILEVTLQKVTEGNPCFTEEDFEKFKEISDQMYLEEQRGDVVYYKHKKVLGKDDDTAKYFSVESFERELVDSLSGDTSEIKIMDLIDHKLTPTQRRRILMLINGFSTLKIAEIEGCNQNAVWDSLQQARRKIKKFLSK